MDFLDPAHDECTVRAHSAKERRVVACLGHDIVTVHELANTARPDAGLKDACQ
jgi:hypothetical protein